MEERRGLPDGELIKSVRASDIFKNYRPGEEIMRHAATADFANHTESGLHDQCSLGQFAMYLSSTNRISQNGYNEQHSSNR